MFHNFEKQQGQFRRSWSQLFPFIEVCENSAVRYVSVNFTSFLRGNSRKPPVRFPEVYNTRKQGGILWLTVSRCGNLVETTQGFPRNGNYGETTDVTIPSQWFLAGFHFGETACLYPVSLLYSFILFLTHFQKTLSIGQFNFPATCQGLKLRFRLCPKQNMFICFEQSYRP